MTNNKLFLVYQEIKKFPAFGGEEKKEFRGKWGAILNKCSSDLMLLLIEEANKDKQEIQKDILEVRKTIDELPDQESKTRYEEKLSTDLKTFTQSLKQTKIRKFQRDEVDYKEGKVYHWNVGKSRTTKGNHSSSRRPKSVSFSFTSSEEEDFAERNAIQDERNSLGQQGRPPYHTKRGKERGHGSRQRIESGRHEGAERNQEPRYTRSRTRQAL